MPVHMLKKTDENGNTVLEEMEAPEGGKSRPKVTMTLAQQEAVTEWGTSQDPPTSGFADAIRRLCSLHIEDFENEIKWGGARKPDRRRRPKKEEPIEESK